MNTNNSNDNSFSFNAPSNPVRPQTNIETNGIFFNECIGIYFYFYSKSADVWIRR